MYMPTVNLLYRIQKNKLALNEQGGGCEGLTATQLTWTTAEVAHLIIRAAKSDFILVNVPSTVLQ